MNPRGTVGRIYKVYKFYSNSFRFTIIVNNKKQTYTYKHIHNLHGYDWLT